MSILKAIKAWWKPEVKEEKIRVRFNRNGHIAIVYYPASYGHHKTIMLNQEIECYKIKIGQTEQYSGLLGQADCFNRNMLGENQPLTIQELQAEAFNRLITEGVRVQ